MKPEDIVQDQHRDCVFINERHYDGKTTAHFETSDGLTVRITSPYQPTGLTPGGRYAIVLPVLLAGHKA